jgi:hypothetical protein
MIEEKQELLVVHVCRKAIQTLVDSVLRPIYSFIHSFTFRAMQDVSTVYKLSPEEIEVGVSYQVTQPIKTENLFMHSTFGTV